MNMKDYINQTHRYGKIWTAAAIVVFLAVPVIISASLGVWPPLDKFLAGFLPILALYGPVGVIEFFSYAPMLGTGGLYVGFITGNLSNLKVPCALNALNVTDTKASDDDGEIISNIAVAVSSIVTSAILLIGVLAFAPVSHILNAPVLAPAFANILPALFGGLGVVYISRNAKIASLPVVLMLLLYIAVPSIPISVLIPVAAVISVLWARLLYKKGKV